MPSLFGSSNEPLISAFEIQLDSDQVLLLGDAYEAEDVYLRGKLIFHNTVAIKTPLVRLSFVGHYYAGFSTFSTGINTIVQQGEFYKQETVLYSENGSTLPPQEHVWPFEFRIKGHQLETLQGLPDAFFSYRLKAVVERGAFIKDHKIYKSVRVVRTYEPTSVALNQSIAVNKIWTNKIKYTFSTPSKAIVFGSSVPCELTMIPLTKGLKIGKIKITLVEEQENHMASDNNTFRLRYPRTRETDITDDVYEVPEGEESVEVDGMEAFVFNRQIQIPRNLRACRLSIDPVLPHSAIVQPHPLVRIKHSLRFVIALINADGHISEVRARLPIALFLTPNQRLNSRHELINSGVILMSNNSDIIASEFGAPPSYGQHEMDETLDAASVPSSGLMTPDLNHSSRGSITDLQGLMVDEQLSANTLYNRLNSLVNPASARFTAEDSNRQSVLPRVLANSNGSSPPNINSRDYFANPGSANEDVTVVHVGQRQSSGSATPPGLPSGSQTPAHIEYDTMALSRVPSYNTASRSDLPRNGSYSGLPTYNEAASRPSSEGRAETSSATSVHQSSGSSRQVSGTAGEQTRRVHYANGTHE